MTRRQLCELIQRRLAGGDVPVGFSPKIEAISLWLEPAVAAAAMKSYGEGASIDIENVGDAFYMTFKDLTLSLDASTGEFYTTVPASPYGIPFGYDVTRAHQRQVSVYKHIPKPVNASVFWFEGAQMRVESEQVLTGKKVLVRMASMGTSANMDSAIQCPSDQLPYVIEFVERKFMQPMPEDLSNDGNNKR